ncbi:MAG: hypothetical protein RIS84_677 [Pseudomonadota bacterium]|jgi:hypothetical protein|nr:DUF1737 domain-containing protein [Thiotrichaceae bacterium]
MSKPIYIIIEKRTDTALAEEVNKKIREGYVPHGNLVICADQAGFTQSYTQALLLRAQPAAAPAKPKA